MIANANLIVQHVIPIKNEIMTNVKLSVKSISPANAPTTCICENSRYWKSIVNDSVILCDEIISTTDSVSANVTNTISINVTGTVSINSNNKVTW